MKNRNLIIVIIAVVAVILIVGATFLALTMLSKQNPDQSPTQAALTVPPSVLPTVAPTDVQITDPTAQEETKPSGQNADDAQMDEELKTLLSYQGISEDDLKEQSTSQIITVSASGNTASVDFWEIRDHQWTKDSSLSTSGYVGEMGVTDNMSEYIQATPRGFFPVLDAFYTNTKPQTGLDTFAITENTYWVDDPDSDFYNQRVEGTQYQDWSSAEHMIDYSAYEYGFVIGYNLSCVKGAGSAIFFHIGGRPTAGCVAVSYDMVLSYLEKLDAGATPYIFIN